MSSESSRVSRVSREQSSQREQAAAASAAAANQHGIEPTMTTRTAAALALALLVTVTPSQSSALPSRTLHSSLTTRSAIRSPKSPSELSRPALALFKIRGGSEADDNARADPSAAHLSNLLSILAPQVDTIRNAIVSGTSIRGVVALAAVASISVLPLTLLIKQSYAFVVGCGFATLAMSLAMMSSFDVLSSSLSSTTAPSILLGYACILYGLRLASLSILRDITSSNSREDVETKVDEDSSTRRCAVLLLKRIPLVFTVSTLYALMTSPVLFALRGANNAKGKLGAITDWLGVAIAYFGSILAATTDFHKYIIERRGIDSESEFDLSSSSSLEGISISHSSFKLARHLNYIGEGMFWIGLYIGGVASFGKDAVAWICGTLGLSGIVGFMFVPWILHLLLSRIKYDHDDDAEE